LQDSLYGTHFSQGNALPLSEYFYRAVVITVSVVLVVQVSVNNIIDMVAMWHGFMTATWPVNVPIFMA
jgi:hypothetical protein